MSIQSDWHINFEHRLLIHHQGTVIYPLSELYRWLSIAIANPQAITTPHPIEAVGQYLYVLKNSWYLDKKSAQFLNDGALFTKGWDANNYKDGIRILSLQSDSYVPAGPSDLGKKVIYSHANSTDQGVLVDFNNDTKVWYVRVANPITTFSNLDIVTVVDGCGNGYVSKPSTTGENVWSQIYTPQPVLPHTIVTVTHNHQPITSSSEDQPINTLVLTQEAGELINQGIFQVKITNLLLKTSHQFTLKTKSGGRIQIPVMKNDSKFTSPPLFH